MPLDIINRSNNNNNIHLGHRCQNATAIMYVTTRTDMLYVLLP